MSRPYLGHPHCYLWMQRARTGTFPWRSLLNCRLSGVLSAYIQEPKSDLAFLVPGPRCSNLCLPLVGTSIFIVRAVGLQDSEGVGGLGSERSQEGLVSEMELGLRRLRHSMSVSFESCCGCDKPAQHECSDERVQGCFATMPTALRGSSSLYPPRAWCEPTIRVIPCVWLTAQRRLMPSRPHSRK